MKFTKFLAAFLAFVMIASLAACSIAGGGSEPTVEQDPQLRATDPTENVTDPTGIARPDDPTEVVEATDPEEQLQESEEATEPEGDHRVEEDEEEIQGDEDFDPDDVDQDGNGGVGGGSSGGEQEQTKDDSGDETGTSSGTYAAKPLSWANINAFPIKSSSMSVDQLRQLCVDYFRYAKTATWTPSTGINFIKNAKGSNDSMTGGNTYGGLPYIGLGSGTMYRLMDYLNEETGVVDMADALNLGGTISMADMKYFGNQCANGAFSGWGRVINSVTRTSTANMVKNNGYIPLGSYTYKENTKNWSSNYQTKQVCEANGRQVMYEAYAKLRPADGMVYYTTAGHVIMASSDPVVKRNGDGTIDGNASYVYIVDQAQSWEDYTTIGGSNCKIKNSVDAKKTFAELFDRHYLPFTFAEFQGTDPVQSTSCSFGFEEEIITTEVLFGNEVVSNYFISDAYVIITDSSDSQVYKHAVRGGAANCFALSISRTGKNVDSWGTYPTSGTYNVEIIVQLYTGERKSVYTGTLKV